MAFMPGKEAEALEKLIKEGKDKDPNVCWLIVNEEKMRFVGVNNMSLALKILPKYECFQKSVSIPSGGPDAEILEVKISFLGKFLFTVLFGDENKKVEIYRLENDKYVCKEKASPGDYSQVKDLIGDDDMGGELPKPIVGLYREKSKTHQPVGLFVVNKVAHTVALCSFQDNKEYDILDSVLESISPSECAIQEEVEDKEKIVKILKCQNISVDERSGLKISSLEKAIAELEKFVDFSKCDRARFEKDEKLAILASTFLTSALSNSRNDDEFKIIQINISDFMKLSSSSIEGLHIFGPTSLFTTLNHTRTAGGERLLKCWIRQPLRDREKIQRRLDLVEMFVEAPSCRKTFHDNSLRKIPDFEKVNQKFDMGRVNLADLFKVYAGIREVKNMKDVLIHEFGDTGLIFDNFSHPFEEILELVSKFKSMMEKTLDFDALESGDYRIKASFDENLTAMKEEQDEVKSKIDSIANRERDRLGMNSKTMKLESSSQHGFFFRVTLKDEKNLRQKKGLTFFDSAKSGVKFRTSELERLNGRFVELSQKYELQQQYIIEEVVQISRGYCKHFNELSFKVSELDCLVSLAVAAEMAPTPYVKPQLNQDGFIDLKKARHPILEQKGCLNYIPNDALLSRKESGNFVIITGPNLGGKSTYMRSVALNVLMAQVGSFVPCSEANIYPIDNLLVRIGASDSQFYGVSTFMSEMLDASRILRHATENSLIIIDEIGRGTSTYDGFGLAWAISHHIASEIKAFTLFATHFHEMTNLAQELDNVTNVFCDAVVEENQLTLLYTVAPGICKNSFGIEVAQMAGFPDEILKDSRKFLAEMEKNSGQESMEVSK